MGTGEIINNYKIKSVNGKVGEGIKFERIRRITGYLVGTLDRFGDAKRSEVEERVKHGLSGSGTKKKNREEYYVEQREPLCRNENTEKP